MLIKKVMITMLATLFCLTFVGVAAAENEHEDVFTSHGASMSSSMDSSQGMSSTTPEATSDQKQQVDDKNSRPVICAASYHNNDNLPQNQANYCKELYGS